MSEHEEYKVYLYNTLYYEVKVYSDGGEYLETELCRKFTSENAAFDYVEELATKFLLKYSFKLTHVEEGYVVSNVDGTPDEWF